MLNINQIYNEDCFNIFKQIPPFSVDLILTDPPYNIADSTKTTKINGKIVSTKEAWGEEFKDNYEKAQYLQMINGILEISDYVLKPNGSVLIFFDRSKLFQIENFYDKLIFKNIIVFIKENPIPHIRKNNYRSATEFCIWFTKSKEYYINFVSQNEMVNYFSGIVKKHYCHPKLGYSHPNEKPDWMIKPLLERHSRKGDLILDPFCGSGAICRYAKEMGRNFIGIEKEKKFYELSKESIKTVKEQLKLFKLEAQKNDSI